MRSYWIACNYCVPGEAYNIGGKDVISVEDFLVKIKQHAKVNIPTMADANLYRPIDVTMQIPDTKKFDDLTGFKLKYSLDESIDFLLDHYRKESR